MIGHPVAPGASGPHITPYQLGGKDLQHKGHSYGQADSGGLTHIFHSFIFFSPPHPFASSSLKVVRVDFPHFKGSPSCALLFLSHPSDVRLSRSRSAQWAD